MPSKLILNILQGVKIIMEINFVKGEIKYLQGCYDALYFSEIGEAYFKGKNLKKILSIGIENGEITVALDNKDNVIGFIWYSLDGAFQKYPYLHIIAINEKLRSNGFGTKIIQYFESEICKDYKFIFLMAADFNTKAKRLYERLGYEQVGIINNFYKVGINECLMMKSKSYFS